MDTMETAITLDGRDFESSLKGLTAAQDHFVLGHLRLAGAVDLFIPGCALTIEEKRVELVTRLLISGRATLIVAGILTERGTKWTRAEAEKNALRFNDITDLDEKTRLRETLSAWVLGFFPLGEHSSASSPRSSSPTGEDRGITNAEAPISETSVQ